MLKTWIQTKNNAACDIFATFGVMLASLPLRPFPDLKDVPTRKWQDRQGDDEFIPSDPTFESYQIDARFVYHGDLNTAGTKIRTFLEYIVGTEFVLVDEFKRKGIRCRYVSYSDDSFYRSADDTVEFTVKLKINNPLCYALFFETSGFNLIANCKLTAYFPDSSSVSMILGDEYMYYFDSDPKYILIVPESIGQISVT